MDNIQPTKKALTHKQRIWLQNYMDIGGKYFGNATKCALIAYYPDFLLEKEASTYTDEERKTYTTAKQIGWENLTKLDMPIEELMNEAGLSDTFLVKKLSEGLDASRPYGIQGRERPDFNARNKALEMALKLKKKLVDTIDFKGGLFSTDKIKFVTVLTDEEKEDTAKPEVATIKDDPNPASSPEHETETNATTS